MPKKEKIPTLRKGQWDNETREEWCQDRGYRSEEMMKIEEAQNLISEIRYTAFKRQEKRETIQLKGFLEKIETIGCSFELKDLVQDGGNTVIADTDGNVVHHTNVGYYLFQATNLEIGNQKRKVCQVYKKLDSGLWMLVNICVGGVWCEEAVLPTCMFGAYKQACGFY